MKKLKIGKLVLGVLILALSALIVSDGALTLIDSSFLFDGVDGGFKIVTGFVFILLDIPIIKDAGN